MDIPSRMKPTLEEQIEIAATPERVWSILADPVAMVRHSPMVVAAYVRPRPVGVGTLAYNLNRKGLLVWPVRTAITEYDQPHRFAFRAKENNAVWSFSLEPSATGTLVTQRRETPDGTTKLSDTLVDRFMGGQDGLTAELVAGMRRTLASIKSEAEGKAA